jgi:chorismate mutase
MIRANGIEPDDVASAIFTTTVDLDATYPALAARQLGWYDVALLCSHEMDVPGGLAKCIRVLVNWNTDRSATEIVHVYLRNAKDLRPDHKELPPIAHDEIEAAINFNNLDIPIRESH